MSNKRRAYQTWFGTTIIAIFYGASYTSIALFYNTIMEQTGCTITECSVVFTAASIGMMLSSFIAGNLIEKNPKLFPAISTFGVLILFGSIYFSTSIYLIWVCAFIYGFSFSIISGVYGNIMITRWFNIGRGKALSIMFAIANGMIAVLIPLYAKLIVFFKGALGAAFIGVGTTIIGLSMVLLVNSKFPEDYNLQPINIGKVEVQKNSEMTETDTYEYAMPALRMAFTPTFLLIFFSVFFISFATNMYSTNSMPIFQSFGLEYEKASLCVSIASITALFLSIISGILIDKIGARITISIYAIAGALSLFISPLMKGWNACIFLALTINFCQIWMMVGSTTLPGIFGLSKCGMLIGWCSGAASICGCIAAPVAANIYERTGSYKIAMYLAGSLVVLAVIMLFFGLSPSMKMAVRKADQKYKKHINMLGERNNV